MTSAYYHTQQPVGARACSRQRIAGDTRYSHVDVHFVGHLGLLNVPFMLGYSYGILPKRYSIGMVLVMVMVT